MHTHGMNARTAQRLRLLAQDLIDALPDPSECDPAAPDGLANPAARSALEALADADEQDSIADVDAGSYYRVCYPEEPVAAPKEPSEPAWHEWGRWRWFFNWPLRKWLLRSWRDIPRDCTCCPTSPECRYLWTRVTIIGPLVVHYRAGDIPPRDQW